MFFILTAQLYLIFIYLENSNKFLIYTKTITLN